MDFEGLVGGFLDHFGVMLSFKNRLGSSLIALFWLEVDFPGSDPPILEGFGELLATVLEIF